MATPLYKNPCPRGQEINNFGRPFLFIKLYEPCTLVEKILFKKHIKLTFIPKNYLPLVGVFKFIILYFLNV